MNDHTPGWTVMMVDLSGLAGGSGYRSDRAPGGGSHPGDWHRGQPIRAHPGGGASRFPSSPRAGVQRRGEAARRREDRVEPDTLVYFRSSHSWCVLIRFCLSYCRWWASFSACNKLDIKLALLWQTWSFVSHCSRSFMNRRFMEVVEYIKDGIM